jgi:outer membrane lipoprotein carrier protein
MRRLTVALLLFPLVALSQELEQMRQFYARLRSVRVEALSPFGSPVTLTVARGNRFRITWSDRLLVCDGTTVWSYTASQRQVVITSAASAPRESSLEYVFGSLLQRAQLRLLSAAQDTLRLECLLVEPSASGMHAAVLTVRRSDWAPLAVEIQMGQERQRWRILRFQPNPPVSADLFRFRPPEGTEVIDLRR